MVQVPTAGVPTLYPIIGDLFGWLAIAGFAVLALWAIVHHHRQAATVDTTQEESAITKDPANYAGEMATLIPNDPLIL